MTPARRLRIWTGQQDAEGIARCGCGCGEPVDLDGPSVRYDHTITFWMRPDLDDDGPNVKAVITSHDAVKTYGSDIPTIAKTKRQIGMRLDVPRPEAKMRGGRKLPGKGQGPKLRSRNTFQRKAPRTRV